MYYRSDKEDGMSEWKELAHFLYGKGFWYADPIREIKGLTEEQLFWGTSDQELLAEIKQHYSGKVVSGRDLDVY
jgi:hypothetical protein